MAKSSNPVDAHRKAQKDKEKKKRKEQRTTAKTASNAKKSTGGLEGEVRVLTDQEAAGTISARDKTRLETLREEVEAIKKAKKEYAAAHPVAESSRAQETLVDIGATKKRSKDPKRSVYYDAVFNPHGTPPPGMPYRERSPTPDKGKETASESEESDENDDIVMPAGPKPDSDSEVEDDLKDIVMPEGPPPPKLRLGPLISRPDVAPPPTPPVFNHPPAPAPFPRPPIHSQSGSFPPPPPGPPPGFPSYPHSQPFNHHPSTPTNQYSAASNQYSAVPQSYQAYPTFSSGPSISAQPGPSSQPKSTTPAQTSYTAEPQIRDLKAESTAFLPTALKRKRAAPTTASKSGLNSVNATGGMTGDEEGEERVGLLSKFPKRDEGKEEYERFTEGVKDLL